MGIEATLRVLNEMQAAGVLADYAIGGAVAAFLYIEPATTLDLDIFTAWTPSPGGLLTPQPFYEYLAGRGYKNYEQEAIVVEGWAVQFLPLGNSLLEEALKEAADVKIKGVLTRVFTREHLMAICLQTGRQKDTIRLLQFIQEGSADMERFAEILQRYNLSQAWETFQTRHLKSR